MTQPLPAPSCIFISYATPDLALAEFVAGLLETRLPPSTQVFIAKRDLEPGSDPLRRMLEERLLRATALIALCSRNSQRSPWLWWETSSVWTRDGLVVPLFVDIEPGDFGGPLVLVRQGRRLFVPGELLEALRAVVERAAHTTDVRGLREDELAGLRGIQENYQRQAHLTAPSRERLLEKLRDLILEAKNAARQAIDVTKVQVSPQLIDVELKIRTVMGQLGDDELPLELTNFAGQAQNAYWVMSNWQSAHHVVARMLIDATRSPA